MLKHYSNFLWQENFVTARFVKNLQEDIDVESEEDGDLVEIEKSVVNDEISDEPRDYVAGYICKKLNLPGAKVKDTNSWIHKKGEGRLIQPSNDMEDLCKVSGIVFDDVHGSGLRLCKNPIKRVVDLILKYNPTFQPQAVNLFCKVIFFARIKKMNIILRSQRLNKSVRSYKQCSYFIN